MVSSGRGLLIAVRNSNVGYPKNLSSPRDTIICRSCFDLINTVVLFRRCLLKNRVLIVMMFSAAATNAQLHWYFVQCQGYSLDLE